MIQHRGHRVLRLYFFLQRASANLNERWWGSCKTRAWAIEI